MPVDRPDWSENPPSNEPDHGGPVADRGGGDIAVSHPSDRPNPGWVIEAEQQAMNASQAEPEGDRTGGDVPASTFPTRTLNDSKANLPASLIQEWRNDPAGFEHRRNNAHKAAEGVLMVLDPDTRQQIESGFSGLPEPVRAGVLAELGMGQPSRARPFTGEQMDELTADWQMQLEQHWKHHSDRQFGVLESRLANMKSRMEPSAWTAATRWFNSLPSKQQVAVAMMLTV